MSQVITLCKGPCDGQQLTIKGHEEWIDMDIAPGLGVYDPKPAWPLNIAAMTLCRSRYWRKNAIEFVYEEEDS